MRVVSFVIPTLEEEGIAAILDSINRSLPRGRGGRCEVLFADDSREPYKRLMDEAIAAFERSHPNVKARRIDAPGLGKGAAVRLGVLASTGDIVFTMDADLPVSLAHVAQFIEILDTKAAAAVIAERPFERNADTPVRFLASRVLFGLQRYFIFQQSRFLDTQCGFKAFRGEVVRSLAARQIVDGGMYDIEYLYVATLENRAVERVSVQRQPELRPSKINTWRCFWVDPRDLVRVKLAGAMGRYAAGEKRRASEVRSDPRYSAFTAEPRGNPTVRAARSSDAVTEEPMRHSVSA